MAGRDGGSMSRIAGAALGLAGLASALAAAADEGVARLVGTWRGPVVENTLGVPLKEVLAELRVDGRAVTARWTTLGEGEASVRLEPGARPGVLAPAAARGLGSMFGGRRAADPLEGEPLLWGRVEGSGGLSVYRLAVSREGRPTLDRYTFRPADPGAEGLAFAASRLGPGGETVGGLRAALGRAPP